MPAFHWSRFHVCLRSDGDVGVSDAMFPFLSIERFTFQVVSFDTHLMMRVNVQHKKKSCKGCQAMQDVLCSVQLEL